MTQKRPISSRSRAVGATATAAQAAFAPASMTPTQALFINALDGTQADNVLAGALSNQIVAKLSLNRDQGRDGWHRTYVTNDELHTMLVDLVNKGDYIDVAIVAGMLLMRQQMLHPE